MVGQVISGIGQALSARRMRKDQEKVLKNLQESNFISPALLQAEAAASKDLNATRYAGQDQDEARIRQSSSNAFDNVSRATTSSTNLVNAAMGIQGNQNRAMAGVGQRLQQVKEGQRGRWTNLLLQKAGQQLSNRRQYEGTKSALQGAIMQNRARQTNALWNAGAGVADAAEAYFSGGTSKIAERFNKGRSGGGGGNWWNQMAKYGTQYDNINAPEQGYV